MVSFREINLFFSSSLELDEPKGSLFLSWVPKVDEMPLVEFFAVFDRLVDIWVAGTVHIGVSVSCESVNSIGSDEKWKISITEKVGIL